MASGSEAGLNFADASAVKEALEGLKEIEDVQFAIIFDKAGNSFAEYQGSNAAPHLNSIHQLLPALVGYEPSIKTLNPLDSFQSTAAGVRYMDTGEVSIAVAPIVSGDKQLGTVVLGIDQEELQRTWPAAVYGRWPPEL